MNMTTIMKKAWIPAMAAGLIFLLPAENRASIELVTVPVKESVQLTIYNSADITMARETRTLTFKKGLNRIQFSWAGTLIDPTSLRLRFLNRKEGLDLMDTTFPPDRGDALQWNIQSDFDGPAQVELTYFTSGLTWQADYVGITSEKEDRITLKGFVKVINGSGEDYPNAEVRLVVGTINLVEKISDLARGPVSYPKMDDVRKKSAQKKFKDYVSRAEEMERDDASGMVAEKKIIKEGISEYFLFTIEGKESIPNGWQKRLKSLYAEDILLETIYRVSDRNGDNEVTKFYEFLNRRQEGKSGGGQLGESPLPDGLYQIFTMNRDRSLTFRASMNSKYVATGDRVKLGAGRTGDIRVVTRVKDYRLSDMVIEKNYYGQRYVKNYRENWFLETTVTNSLPRDIMVEVERKFGGDYEVKGLQFKTYQVDSATFRYFPDLPERSKKTFTYQVSVFKGTR